MPSAFCAEGAGGEGRCIFEEHLLEKPGEKDPLGDAASFHRFRGALRRAAAAAFLISNMRVALVSHGGFSEGAASSWAGADARPLTRMGRTPVK